MGRPILGTVNTITALPQNAIRRFYRKAYTPDRMVISVAGNVDHAQVGAPDPEMFADRLEPSVDAAPARPARRRRWKADTVRIVSRATEQAHVMMGTPGLVRGDERRYAVAVLSTALGGGMSSRLFQEVREKRGLAYSVFAYAQSFADAGVFAAFTPGVCRRRRTR